MADEIEEIENSKPILGVKLYLSREDLLKLEKWGQIFKKYIIPNYGVVSVTLTKSNDDGEVEVFYTEYTT